jgi:hypothetical protein
VQLRLLYSGLLPPNGGVSDKFAIRRQFSTQLARLWRELPSLREMSCREAVYAVLASGGAVLGGEDTEANFGAGIVAMGDNFGHHGFKFIPLAQESFYLKCSVDILFLRREGPGKVVMNGDIDNRLKTLFDALQMPLIGQDVGDEIPGDEPLYVLLQNDKLIANLSVTTDRLLDVPVEFEHRKDYAVLVLNVKLEPTRRVTSNWVFS